MKYNFLILLCIILLGNTTMGQCPNSASITAAGKCIRLTWTTAPSPLPTYIMYNGVRFNFVSGDGTSASPAIFRDPNATGSCSSYSQANATITLPSGQACVYTNGTTLPLYWLSISGNFNSSKQAVLNFKVQETNVASYSVEKSTNGSIFTTIAAINSKGDGENNYQFTDTAIVNGTIFYRIKQLDNGAGRYGYSSILRLTSNANGVINIYPNPVKDIVMLSGASVGTKAFITDINGSVLQTINITAASITISMSNYSSGIYLLKTDGRTQKIIKL